MGQARIRTIKTKLTPTPRYYKIIKNKSEKWKLKKEQRFMSLQEDGVSLTFLFVADKMMNSINRSKNFPIKLKWLNSKSIICQLKKHKYNIVLLKQFMSKKDTLKILIFI